MPNSYTSVRTRQIGATLRQSRRVSGMVGEFVAGKLGVSVSKISRLESGQRPPKLADVAGMLALYGVTGKAREDLLKLCEEAEAGETGWWQRREMSKKQRTLIELESTATKIIKYQTQFVPGLLQTGEYTYALLRDVLLVPEDEIEDRMVTRLARHSLLMRNRPPQLLAIISEQALRLPLGGRDVLRRQLRHLILSARQPHITIRIIPQSTAVHPGLYGPFNKMEFAAAPPVVFLEDRTSCQFLEDKDEVGSHDMVLDKLVTVALSAGESAELLADLADEARQDPSEEAPDGSIDSGSPLMA